MVVKDALKSSAFMMTFAMVIALITNFSGAFPSEVLTANLRSELTIWTLIIMLTLSLSRIPFKNLNPIVHWKSVLRAIVLGLLVASIIPLLGYYILKDTEFGIQSMGLIFIASTPFAGSVVPLSYILNGDTEHASRSIIIIYILSIIWIPFVIWLTIGETVDMTNVIIVIAKLIFIPLVISRLITRLKVNNSTMSVFLNICIFFMVWLSVGSTTFSGELYIFIAFVIIAALRSFGLGTTIEITEKKIGICWSQRITDVLMASYKNKGIAIALCMSVLAPTGYAPTAMVAIATSILVEIMWVVFMSSILFNENRMKMELKIENSF
ncbi:MAG: Na+-dependent transporter [archaeon]|nr:Na+-dependent transporter [archaeon]